jgi:hypothetical protein
VSSPRVEGDLPQSVAGVLLLVDEGVLHAEPGDETAVVIDSFKEDV